MSILKSMNIGVSGLRANGRSMSTIGDNIANVNTVGYKRSRTNFNDVLAATTMGVGDGVGVGGQQQHFEQGTLEMTGVSTDMAITGRGFFAVQGTVDGREGEFYTRAGQFMVNKDGLMVTTGGLKLQGYGVDSNGEINQASVGDLQVGGITAPPQATTEMEVGVNLDADEEVLTDPWDPANPSETSNYSTSVTMYDSLGNAIETEVYYRKTGPNSWEYHAMVDGGDVTGGTAGTPTEIGTGTLDFDTDGNLTTAMPVNVSFNPINATQPQDVTIDFTGTTQFAGDSTLRELDQDGFTSGELRDLEIAQDGTITGIFSNGERQTLGQVALVDFQAPEGLNRLGNNLWDESQMSGEPMIGTPGSGGRGGVAAGALEGSNVDLAHEFVKMIASQRGYQANARTVTTGDEMLQEAMNLKR
ncbi:flagellar hook protein FlgE [Persicimonas caeni]|uniref:Flagellar hook protein FlgE n=1 Tax=Persicimonas caeni TaxID=2292766 RepID=A0A4Y6PSM6_PERCE|nr:flagellar hook protein FlgE [Persicimonas caeni]QDG51336.1 flagellar hook protein FlgE [Persicimonas caeni]QED32557.1 flagellar hook protein FlgE [Persicimonas caeni]